VAKPRFVPENPLKIERQIIEPGLRRTLRLTILATRCSPASIICADSSTVGFALAMGTLSRNAETYGN
jgi:hypothetical protein